jgi:hypothetical protein
MMTFTLKNLMRKELKLCLHPTCWIFLSFVLMFLIPSYPFYVSYFYMTMAIFFIFVTGRETDDVLYTALLPVRKSDSVRARTLTVAALELTMMLLSVPVVILRQKLYGGTNLAASQAGTDPGVAFFGLALIMFAVFNLVMIPGFYKTARNAGKPFFLACGAMLVYVIGVEIAIQAIPALQSLLDTTDPSKQLAQLPVLLVGIALYLLYTWLSCRRGVKNFSRVDL